MEVFFIEDEKITKWINYDGDVKDEKGNQVSSGLYFYQLKIRNKIIDTKKCLLLK